MDAAGPMAVVGGQVVLEGGLIAGDVIVVDGRIASIGTVPSSFAGETLDAAGYLVAPGFVDIQTNGGHGIDLALTPRGMWDLGVRLLRDGVTSFLPTIITSPPGTIYAAIDALHSRPDRYMGAEALGLHLEGPMLNPACAGAHPRGLIRPPSLDLSSGWCARDGITMVTLAPEISGAIRVVEALRERGVTVAVGHSNATYEQMAVAVDAGVTQVTHLYNAMSSSRHGQPGVAGYALQHGDVTAGIIADGIHSHPEAVAAAWNAKGATLALVTDAAPARGLQPGPATLGSTEVTVCRDGSIRTGDGTLAGSNLSMDQAVGNLAAWTKCGLHNAIHAASTVPARIIGADSKAGIAVGADADLVLIDPELNVVVTIVGGRVLYTATDAVRRPTGSCGA